MKKMLFCLFVLLFLTSCTGYEEPKEVRRWNVKQIFIGEYGDVLFIGSLDGKTYQPIRVHSVLGDERFLGFEYIEDDKESFAIEYDVPYQEANGFRFYIKHVDLVGHKPAKGSFRQMWEIK